jgi:hypothetical protein
LNRILDLEMNRSGSIMEFEIMHADFDVLKPHRDLSWSHQKVRCKSKVARVFVVRVLSEGESINNFIAPTGLGYLVWSTAMRYRNSTIYS